MTLLPRSLCTFTLLAVTLAAVALAGPVQAQGERAAAKGARDPLPVREVTAFKDGHAFVLREGTMQPDADGRVVLESLPVPVLGTFWPYATGDARVVSATAAKDRVVRQHEAVELRDWIDANAGADVVLVDINNESIEGKLLPLPRHRSDAAEAAPPAPVASRPAEDGAVVLVRTSGGTRVIPLARVRDITIKGEAARTFSREEPCDRLTVRLQRAGAAPTAPATVGIVYVQHGLRWIPSYRFDIDGKGQAAVRMEATLVDDLIDLEDATVNLVIGVPHFEFAGQVDPISLQELAAQLAAQARGADRFNGFLSNAIQTQSAAYVAAPAQPSGPEPQGGEANEDLFVFTVKNVTLKKGERLVLPITEFTLPYRDVYVLEVPFAPPVELNDQMQRTHAAELARLLAAPKAMHVLRLQNRGAMPLTTAPALLFRDGRIVSQSLLTYTPVGAESDLPLTTAIDICVEASDNETGRTPNATRWGDRTYGRIDVQGTIALTNKKKEAIDIEVRRLVLGLADEAGQGGAAEQKSLAEFMGMPGRTDWLSWWNWPWWWQHLNGVGRFAWKVHLETGASTKLDAKWHYLWQ